MKKRKAINFYRSYYEVLNELPKKYQLEFVKAILDYQFTGEEPALSNGIKLAWISQKHSLDKQLKGYKHGQKGGRPPKGTSNPPPKGTSNQEQVQEQVQEKEKEKDKLKREFLKSQYFFDALQKRHNLKQHRFEIYKSSFIEMVDLEKYNLESLRKYFLNWLNGQVKNDKPAQTGNMPSGISL